VTAEEPSPRSNPLIFLVAGEPSGDMLGGRLMAALRHRGVDRFAGVGGERMGAQGLTSLFPMSDLSVMGLAEVVPRLPKLLRRIDETARAIKQLRPDAVVTIDAPDFVFRVARKVKGEGIPLVHYVAPTVWAWRPGRAKTIASFLDHLLALLPFEPPYFEAVGLPCTYVGHPVLESGAAKGDGRRFRATHGLGDDQPVLALLPGSRRGEVSRLLPEFVDALRLLAKTQPDLVCTVPAIAGLADLVRAGVQASPFRTVVVEGETAKFDAFAASRAALAASGTVALELALARVPTVIAYKVNPLSAAAAPFVIRLRHVSLVNIILGRPVVPELLQDRCRPGLLAEAVGRLLRDAEARQEQIAAADEVARELGVDGLRPSQRAADVVLRLAQRGRPG
jgi:lipid-A-disaccharide synthase